MQSKTTTWISGGETHSVTTTRNEGKMTVDWVARHKEAVDAFQASYPRDP